MPPQEFAPDGDGLMSVQGLGAESLGTVAAKGEADRAPLEQQPDFEFKGDGTVNVRNISPQMARRLQELLTVGTQTKQFVDSGAATHLANLARLGAQTQQTLERGAQMALQKAEVLQQHPIVSQLGRTLSAAALNYSAPLSKIGPLIRGIGAYGAEFFQDTPESLIQRAAALRQQQFQTEGAIVNQLEDQKRFELQQTRIDQAIAEERGRETRATAREKGIEERAVARQRQTEINNARGRMSQDASAGRAISADTAEQELIALGDSPEQAKAFARRIAETAKAEQGRQTGIENRRLALEEAKVNLAARSEKVSTLLTRINLANDDMGKLSFAKENARQWFSQTAGALGIGAGTATFMANRLRAATPEDLATIGIDPTKRSAFLADIARNLATIKTADAQLSKREAEINSAIASLPKDLQPKFRERPVVAPPTPASAPAAPTPAAATPAAPAPTAGVLNQIGKAMGIPATVAAVQSAVNAIIPGKGKAVAKDYASLDELLLAVKQRKVSQADALKIAAAKGWK